MRRMSLLWGVIALLACDPQSTDPMGGTPIVISDEDGGVRPDMLPAPSGCERNEACEVGFICDLEVRECVPGCRTDLECEQGYICHDNLCFEGCRDDEGCPEGAFCAANRTCVVGCQQDEDCDQGTICNETQCIEGCRDDEGCQEGEVCSEGLCTRQVSVSGVGMSCYRAPDGQLIQNFQLSGSGEYALARHEFAPGDVLCWYEVELSEHWVNLAREIWGDQCETIEAWDYLTLGREDSHEACFPGREGGILTAAVLFLCYGISPSLLLTPEGAENTYSELENEVVTGAQDFPRVVYGLLLWGDDLRVDPLPIGFPHYERTLAAQRGLSTWSDNPRWNNVSSWFMLTAQEGPISQMLMIMGNFWEGLHRTMFMTYEEWMNKDR